MSPDDASGARPSDEPALSVRSLGALEIRLAGEVMPAAAWSYAKPRELLLFLLCHPDGRTREQVGVALWPEASTAQVRNNFHVTVHHLRRTLGDAAWVRLEQGRYRVAPPDGRTVHFDAVVFERSASDALRQARRWNASVGDLRRTVALYRGDFLEHESMGDWHRALRDRLRHLFVDTLLALGDALLVGASCAEAIDVLERLIAAEELHEGAWRRSMVAYARAGDRTAAMRQYQRLREVLRRELGASPDAESTALFNRLQRGDSV